MPYIAVIGSINADISVNVQRHPKPGETLLGSGGEVTPGGKGANQAVAAALRGADVRFVGAVGQDANAQAALAVMESLEIDLSNVTRTEQPTGLAVITVDAAGENTIIVAPGANATVDAASVADASEVIAGADIVLLQGEIPAAGLKQAVELACKRVIINLAPVIPVDRDALLQADPLVVNEHEALLVLEQLTGQLTEQHNGQPHSPATPADEDGDAGCEAAPQGKELVEALLAQGFASVVLTLGARGSLVGDKDGIHRVDAAQATVVDTTGAGDAFTGALAAGLLAGDSLIEACQQASRVAAFSVGYHGAQTSYPGLAAQLPLH